MVQISDERLEKNLERLKRLRLMDDDFMAVCFDGDNECTEFVLRILLNKDDLHVIDVKSQYSVKNLQGHSVILDVFATDSEKKKYDIEIQRADKGASPKRARYNSSLMDDQILAAGDSYEILPETYVIFITENDVLGKDLPIYHIDRMIAETMDVFGDGSHIVYVNGANKDDSALGKLMHDFSCTDPGKMNYALLAQKTRYFKEYTQGGNRMSRIMEEIFEEGKAEGFEAGKAEAKAEAKARDLAIKNAISMLKDGLQIEKVSKYTNLSIEEVKEFAALLAD